jgi:hypothetical protein
VRGCDGLFFFTGLGNSQLSGFYISFMHFLACQIAPVPVQSACYFVTFFFSSMAAILAAYFPPASNGLCPVTVEFLVLGACCALRLKERLG